MELLFDRAFIEGEWVGADATFDVVDPATGDVLAQVARGTEAMTRQALDAAEAALPAWRATPAIERAKIMRRLERLLLEHEDALAHLLTREQGKPLGEARGEIRYAASFLDWFAGEAPRMYGETIPSPWPDRRLHVIRQAVGVAAGITPWNFPSAMPARKLAPALAAGCTFVLKPAENTPLSALAFAELARRAGVPTGVFSVVPGAREDAATIGGVLTGDARVRKLSFTGSTAVGKILLEQCASTIKKVSLELGGNAPLIVFDDADLDAAVEGVMVAKFRNAGQVCVAANRILVQRAIYARFADRLAKRVSELRVGPGLEEGVDVGPLIDQAGLEKVEAHIENATGGGATVRVGAKRHERGGTFFQPTLLEGVSMDMKMACEETFGPVAGLTPFDTEDEAIQIANDTPYGLASYFYSRDVGRVARVSEALEYGMVGVNTGLMSTTVAPFGGIKESGLGREGSKHGLEEWTELKYVCTGL